MRLLLAEDEQELAAWRREAGSRDGPTVKRRRVMWDADYLKIVPGLKTPQ